MCQFAIAIQVVCQSAIILLVQKQCLSATMARTACIIGGCNNDIAESAVNLGENDGGTAATSRVRCRSSQGTGTLSERLVREEEREKRFVKCGIPWGTGPPLSVGFQPGEKPELESQLW